MNLPNKLTVFRVIMIPFFLFFYFFDTYKYHMIIAFLIFVIAALTDMLDGKIARKHNLVTNFGKLMDPLADKLLVTAAMVCILAGGYSTYIDYLLNTSPKIKAIISVLVLILVLSRDLIVNSIRLVAASEGTIIAADIFGKIKTVLQMSWLSLALLSKDIWGIKFNYSYVSDGIKLSEPAIFGWGRLPDSFVHVMLVLETLLYIGMIVLTVGSGINYVLKNKKLFADA